jgi:hypothetical protein
MICKKTSLQNLCLAFLLAISFYASAQTENSDSSSNWTPNSLDLRILEVRVEQYTFDDFVAGYQFENIILLPLGAISELIDVAIEVQSETASGFVLNESRTFFLDTTRNEVTLQGAIKKYDPDKVHIVANDIYVESDLLGEWLDMSLNVDLFAARIWVESDEPLPFQRRLERDKIIARSLSRLNSNETKYPRHHEPYQNWNMPFVDQSFRLSERKTRDGNSVTDYQYTTYATADVAQHEAELYFSGNDDDQSDDFRLTFSRRDPEGGLLGGLNAKEYSFGHLAEPRLALINQPSSLEAGVSVSNFPLNRQGEFDRNRFIGELLPNWEVELYRNNILIGYQAAPVNGQYDFPDVPILFGSNYFRLVFYGPQGQTRIEETNFDLKQSQTRVGERLYRITATEDEEEGERSVIQYDMGLTKHLSATANLASIPLDDDLERKQHNYLNAGLRSYWDRFFVTFDVIDDSQSGDATEVNLQTRLGSTIFNLTDTTLNDFFSEEFRPDEVELSHRSSLRIDTAIPPGILPRVSLSFEFTVDEFADGGELNEFINLISTNTRNIAISNQLVRQEISDQDPTSSGSLQLSGSYTGMRWRGNVNYSLDPEQDLDSVALTADPGEYGDYFLTVGLSHTLDPNLTEALISANKGTGRYNLSLGGRYNSEDEITLDASLSVSFGHEPRSKVWVADARTMAANGSVSALVFLDNNQDGVFDEGDEPLPDIGFRTNGGYNSLRTNDNGVGFLTGLPKHQPLDLSVSQETITDPLWTVAREGVNVVPRQGHTIQVEFPIFLSGEIDGTVYLAKDGQQYGVGSVTVELVDFNDKVIKTASTAYDGFYIISSIPMGQYYLRVSPRQQTELELLSNDSEVFSIDSDNLFLNGFDFVLR